MEFCIVRSNAGCLLRPILESKRSNLKDKIIERQWSLRAHFKWKLKGLVDSAPRTLSCFFSEELTCTLLPPAPRRGWHASVWLVRGAAWLEWRILLSLLWRVVSGKE